jgi:hypothetical protein
MRDVSRQSAFRQFGAQPAPEAPDIQETSPLIPNVASNSFIGFGIDIESTMSVRKQILGFALKRGSRDRRPPPESSCQPSLVAIHEHVDLAASADA